VERKCLGDNQNQLKHSANHSSLIHRQRIIGFSAHNFPPVDLLEKKSIKLRQAKSGFENGEL
jgi:hypothetical protein